MCGGRELGYNREGRALKSKAPKQKDIEWDAVRAMLGQDKGCEPC